MSIDTYARVWKYAADRRGTRKLLLLALADFADPLGICWPNYDTLAAMLTEDKHYVGRLIGQAKDDGDLFLNPGLGRGNLTIYGIAVGLACQERQRLAVIVRHTVVRKNVRYLEIDGQRIAYTPGSEEQLFTEKGHYSPPFWMGKMSPMWKTPRQSQHPVSPRAAQLAGRQRNPSIFDGYGSTRGLSPQQSLPIAIPRRSSLITRTGEPRDSTKAPL
jgi:hypothetical protein